MSSAPALLHLGANCTTVALGTPGEDARIVRLALGHGGVPAMLFGGDIPTALELEHAIAAVEDEVMPAVPLLAGVTGFVTTDPELRALVAASTDGGDVLSQDRVEWLFDEVSRAALGGPVSHLPLALTKASAAAILIVRELMHHAGIRTLRCLH